MSKRMLAEGEVAEQKVRTFQGGPALNFPRSALYFLKVTSGDTLKFQIQNQNAILVTVAPRVNRAATTELVETGVDNTEVNEFISHTERSRRNSHRRTLRL